MLSTVHTRALARAPRLLRSPIVVSVSTSADGDGGGVTIGASLSAQRATTPPLIDRSAAPLKNNRRVYPTIPSMTRGSHNHNQMMYSSLASSSIGSSVLIPSRKGPRHNSIQNTTRTNFSYAGPRKLSDILKTELLDDKSSAEISDMWMTYHEGKEKVHGLTLDEAKGKSVLARAAQCPFFIHPVFREEGHFMIISQFQSPNYFLLAFLEDYRLDPARAQPLLTISIFDDMAEKKGVTLVRCDIINRGIEEDEGYKICKCLLEDYLNEEDFRSVHMFNKKPDAFDVDEFVKEKERRWKEGSSGGGEQGNAGGEEIEAASAESKKDNAV